MMRIETPQGTRRRVRSRFVAWAACALTVLAVGTGAGAATPVQDAATEASEDVVLLRLRDGRTVWGSILGHDPDAISLLPGS